MDCCNRKSKSRSRVSDRFEAIKLRTRRPSSAKARATASGTELSSIFIHHFVWRSAVLRHANRISTEIKRHALGYSFETHGYGAVRVDNIEPVIAHIFRNSIGAVTLIFPAEAVRRLEIFRI